MYNRDYERQQYEDWHRHGRERGWFDRAADEFRSWFGDEEAERRRRVDQIERGERCASCGHEAREMMPGWQQRDYSGPSPRGSELEERGRYDMETGPRRRWGGRYGSEYGGNRWDMPERYGRGREDYGMGRRGGYGRRFYNEPIREGDFETGMDYEYDEPHRRNFFGGEYRGGFFGRRQEPMSRSGERAGFFGGTHIGRGPRNFQRSDERISDEVHQILTFHPDIDASDIEVLVDKGIVTLRGKVDNRMDKRLAEDLVEDVYGVREVRNEMRVEHGLFNRGEEAKPQPRSNPLPR